MMGVFNGYVAPFPQMLGEDWGREDVGDGLKRMGVLHLGFFSLVADC